MPWQNCGDTEGQGEPGEEPGPNGKDSGRGKTLLWFRNVMGSEDNSSEDPVPEPSRKAAIAHGMPVP